MRESLQTIEARLEQIERQNRRLRWLVLVLPLATLLAGAAGPDIWEGKKVVAEEIVLKDKNGAVRVLIKADVNGFGPSLFMYTKKDKMALAAGQSKDNGIGFIDFYDEGNFKGGVGGNSLKKEKKE